MQVWNHVTNAAYEKDQIVYAMDQYLTAGASGPGGLKDGYCFGLAATWIKLRTWLSDHPYDRDTWVLSSPDPRSMDVQRVFDAEINKSGDAFAAMGAGFAKLGLKLASGRSQYTEDTVHATGLYNVLQRGNAVAKGGDGMYIVGMRNDSMSHAIAIANEADGHWRLFDGNYGHFRMQGNDVFKTFLIDYFKSGGTGYLRTYNRGWLTAGVTFAWA